MELLVTIIILALIFDYINGFHDAANSIATIVSTKVLTPFQAVLWAAFFNFVAFFIAKYIIGGFGIANTVSKTVVEQYITLPIILAGIIAAISWNLITWWKGIPSSSSHTLIGGFAGAAIMANGFVFGWTTNKRHTVIPATIIAELKLLVRKYTPAAAPKPQMITFTIPSFLCARFPSWHKIIGIKRITASFTISAG